jgi:transposase-like protein
MHLSERKRRITGTGTKDKTAVMGILERGGKVRTTVVPSRKKRVLQDEVRKHVTAGTALYSDALLSYNGLATDYAHKVVDHAVQYVDGRVHTNGLENFWSLLKRGIYSQRFELAMSQVFGKRLTYDQLTGKNSSPHHETTGTRETQVAF